MSDLPFYNIFCTDIVNLVAYDLSDPLGYKAQPQHTVKNSANEINSI